MSNSAKRAHLAGAQKRKASSLSRVLSKSVGAAGVAEEDEGKEEKGGGGGSPRPTHEEN